MNLLGFNITRGKTEEKAVQAVDNRGGWFSIIREGFTGAWQSNVELKLDTSLSHSAVFRCISLISSDVAKLNIQLMRTDSNDIMTPVKTGRVRNVLVKPNRYQNRIQFMSNWVQSKLISGNTYVLLERGRGNVVEGMYVLHPDCVKPLVADNGDIFYELSQDNLSGLTESRLVVPASEIIHDRINTFFHPLVGVSPLYACGLAAAQGLAIQENSTNFFSNGSQPGGILSAPGAISDETATRLKEAWQSNYSGKNSGKIAVLGDDLQFKPMAMSAVDSQLIDQLKWSAETICSVFGVPAFKVGIGEMPTYTNIEALDQQYYSQCLQFQIESIELVLDEGLDLDPMRTQFNIDQLIRMDSAAMVSAEKEAVAGGIKAPNESRKKMNLPPVKGGETPYLQQQNYSLEALAERGAQDLVAPAQPEPEPIEDQALAFLTQLQKEFA